MEGDTKITRIYRDPITNNPVSVNMTIRDHILFSMLADIAMRLKNG